MSGTDILAQARAHDWWYRDINMANNLIHEIEELRADNARLRSNLRAAAEQIDKLREHFAIQAEGEADDARLI